MPGSEIEKPNPSLFLGDERQAFDRLDSETRAEHDLFLGYARLGAKRSYAEVSAKFEVPRDRIQKLGAKHGWVQRAEAFDEEMNRKALKEIEDQAIPVRARHMAMLAQFAEKIESGIALLDPYRITPRDMPAMVETLIKYERLTAGISDAPKKIEISGPGGNPIEMVSSMSAQERRVLMAQLKAELANRIADETILEIEDAEVVEDPDGEPEVPAG